MQVVGVDGHRNGWVAVVVSHGDVVAVESISSAADLAQRYPNAAAIGIDIPIGLPTTGVRLADIEARAFVGPRRSSVFATPPRRVLESASYSDPRAVAVATWVQGVSAQAYRLGPKILEVDMVAAEDACFIEVHPEVSFRALAGRDLEHNKRTWNGQTMRRELLRGAGIHIRDMLSGEVGAVAVDDVLDAAAAAWSASRFAGGLAQSLPNPPERLEGRDAAIWY